VHQLEIKVLETSMAFIPCNIHRIQEVQLHESDAGLYMKVDSDIPSCLKT